METVIAHFKQKLTDVIPNGQKVWNQNQKVIFTVSSDLRSLPHSGRIMCRQGKLNHYAANYSVLIDSYYYIIVVLSLRMSTVVRLLSGSLDWSCRVSVINILVIRFFTIGFFFPFLWPNLVVRKDSGLCMCV